MKHLYLLLTFFCLTACKTDSIDKNPEAYLSDLEQKNFKYSIIRYTGRLAKKATHQSKFNQEFDQEYKALAEATDLAFYYPDPKSGEIYFAVTKIAPSLTLKKIATVGKLKKDNLGNIIAYEEAFRTWKMAEPELLQKTELLFLKYIKGEDLMGFYTANSLPEFYIEFPDQTTYYDVKNRIWKTVVEQN